MSASAEDQSLAHPEYRTTASWDGDGELCDSNGNVLQRFRSVGRQFGQVPPFAVRDNDGREVVCFVCRKRFPRGLFEITRGGERVGEVRQTSLLFTRYVVSFDDGATFVFRFPLFTVYFSGRCDSGSKIEIRMWAHQVWLARVDPTIDSPRLAAVLAFMHRERLRHG